ncbi:MAG: hypothetical protein DRQ55_01530 [Planctomycetota bacterium]|nr:MAG: hypothetical protein DRQ55_01530 [Planctomycetota bacterium]
MFSLTLAAFCLAPTPLRAQARPVTQPAPHPGASLPDAVSGEQAIARLGAELPQLATRHGMSADELRSELRGDPTLWLKGSDTLLFVDRPAPPPGPSDAPSYSGSIPTSQAFLLHTDPDSKKVIYLDFNGHHSHGNGWAHNIHFPAWNSSGSSASFSESELRSIIAHWEYVAEDFAPWDVDVTTEAPPIDDILGGFMGDDRYGVRVVMTQVTSGFGSGSGGIAVLGSYGSIKDTPVFVFNKGDNTGSMSASHEVGHAMHLLHDGLNGSTYHPGTGSGATSWGPIMGAPFGKTVVQWSSGDYPGSSTSQLDLYVIGGAPTNLYPDDAGDSLAEASPLAGACPDVSARSVDGVIGWFTDVDAWSFETSGGFISITANPHTPGPNLDIELALYDGTGALLEIDQPGNATHAAIARNLPAGSYVVTIDGVGKSGVYSDYGSLGQYTLSVDAPAVGAFTDLGNGLAGSGGLVPVLSGTGLPCEGNLVTTTLDSALPNSSAWLVYGFSQLNVFFKGGTMVPDFGAGGDFLPVAVGAAGSVSLPSSWPAAVPAGVQLVLQYWVQDAAGPAGFSASNGLELLTP